MTGLMLLAGLVIALAFPLSGLMFGADAGRECTGEQPPGLASGVSTEDGVPRGC
jgi:hypothetical protein